MPKLIYKALHFLLVLAIFYSDIQAAEFEVKSFEKDPNDLAARKNDRTDINGNTCALVKVKTDIKGLNFESGYGICLFTVIRTNKLSCSTSFFVEVFVKKRTLKYPLSFITTKSLKFDLKTILNKEVEKTQNSVFQCFLIQTGSSYKASE